MENIFCTVYVFVCVYICVFVIDWKCVQVNKPTANECLLRETMLRKKIQLAFTARWE